MIRPAPLSEKPQHTIAEFLAARLEKERAHIKALPKAPNERKTNNKNYGY